MSWDERVVTALGESDIDLVAYLPDSVVAGLVERIVADDDIDAVPVAREEEAVGVLSGAWLGGRRGALVCQSSGLATTINALGSLSTAAGLPFLGLVSRRGDLNEFNPAQTPVGYALPRLLDDIGVRNHSLDDPERIETTIAMAATAAFEQQEPYVVLLERLLTEGDR